MVLNARTTEMLVVGIARLGTANVWSIAGLHVEGRRGDGLIGDPPSFREDPLLIKQMSWRHGLFCSSSGAIWIHPIGLAQESSCWLQTPASWRSSERARAEGANCP